MTPTQQFIEDAKRDYMRKPQPWELCGIARYQAFLTTKKSDLIYIVVVDERDAPLVSKYRWYIEKGYTITCIKNKRVRMHHLIVGKPPEGLVTDHIDRDRLNNTRENLRFVTAKENAKNKAPARGYRKRGKVYEAYITVSLGTFGTEIEAKSAYVKAKKTIDEALEALI